MKKFLTVLLCAMLLCVLALPVLAEDVAYISFAQKNSNDGLTPETAKQSFDAQGSGIVGVIPNGGTLVVVGKCYFANDYTIKIPMTITANYDGVDYKNPAPAKNPAAGSLKIKGNCTLSIAADVTLDDLILFQEAEPTKIVVKDGATLTVTDKIVCMTAKDWYIDIEVEAGAKAIINGGTFQSITGNGDIQVADNVTVIADGDAPVAPDAPSAPAGEAGVAFQSFSGSDSNSGTTAQYPKKTFGRADQTGVMSVIPNGGTLVITGKGYVGGDYTFPMMANPLTITSVYGGTDYQNPEPAANPNCAFKIAAGKTVTFQSDVIFDNIILFQEAAQNTLVVKKGATLTVTDTVTFMSKPEYHFKLVVEEGAKAILSAEAQETFSLSNQGGTIETYVSTAAPAVPAEKTVLKLTIGKMVGIVNGVEKALDAAPIIKNSRTMLPVRFVAENLGGTVGWDGATSSVTIKGDGIDISIKIGDANAMINGYSVKLDSPAFIESSRTYLPVRVVAEAMGATVEWDGATSTATLTK